MKLIGTYPSPFVRKVRIVLAEKKIEYEFVIDSPWVATNTLSQHNPLGRIPVLILDDESVIYDSRVIVEHLDSGAPNNKLIPPSGRERTVIKRWEALGDGLCEAAVAAFLEAKRKDGERSDKWTARQLDRINTALAAIEIDVGEQPWCQGTTFSLADIAIGTALGYIDFRLPDVKWRDTCPNLARVYEKICARPSFADTVPHA